jgi:hypothetical protein
VGWILLVLYLAKCFIENISIIESIVYVN